MENLRKPAWKFSISAIYAGAKSLYIPHRDFLEFRWKLFLKPGGSHPSGLIGECHRGVGRRDPVMDLCHGERIIQASVTVQSKRFIPAHGYTPRDPRHESYRDTLLRSGWGAAHDGAGEEVQSELYGACAINGDFTG